MTKFKQKFFSRPKGLTKLVSEFIFGSSSSSRDIINLIKKLKSKNNVLVIGSAEKTYIADLIIKSDANYYGLDIYQTEYVTNIGNAEKMDFKNDFFDLIIIQSVLEHLKKPNDCIDEIYRVLRCGGFVYSEAPFMQEVHEPGSDYLRFSPEAHLFLFRSYKVLSIEITKGVGYSLLWTIRYLIASLINDKKFAGLLCLPFFWLRYFEKIIPVNKFLWDACLETSLIALKDKNINAIDKIEQKYLMQRSRYKKIKF